jgi:hypothetical protein
MRTKIENDRRVFLTSMAQIKREMILGADKNLYVEPTIWTIEWARDHYKYPGDEIELRLPVGAQLPSSRSLEEGWLRGQ